MHSTFADLYLALWGRGLTVLFDSDGSGHCLVVALERPSELRIVDLDDSWRVHHIDLSGNRASIHEDPARDVTATADAVAEFVAHRNRELVAAELAQAINSHLACEVARTYDDDTGIWVVVEQAPPGDGTQLVVASYPDVHRGVCTSGQPITGWIVSGQRLGQGPPDYFVHPHQVEYEDPDIPETEPLMAVIRRWVYGHR